MLTIKNNLTNTHGHIGAGSKLDELVTLSMHYGHNEKQNSLNLANKFVHKKPFHNEEEINIKDFIPYFHALVILFINCAASIQCRHVNGYV